MHHCFTISTSSGSGYPVLCGEDAATTIKSLWQTAWRQGVIIGDSNTVPLFAPSIEASIRPEVDQLLTLSFPAGDQHKTRETKRGLEDQMLAAGIDRSACVIALGGGVALDLAGFVAATYLRGLPHLNVATSLLAQVDAAIGGKTGVNTKKGKNLIGAFYPPKAVLLDTRALLSLPKQEQTLGLAEAIKHAIIADADLLSEIEAWVGRKDTRLDDGLIIRCAQIKADVVSADEHEQGRRAVLNFGHTIAHAIEAATSHRVPHGEAVGAGMVLEAWLAHDLDLLSEAECHRIESVISQVGLPNRPLCEFDAALPFLKRDKKNRESELRFALPKQIGMMATDGDSWTRAVDIDVVKQVWRRMSDSCSA